MTQVENISGLTDSIDWAPERHEAECVVEDASSVEERGGEAEQLFTLHLHPSEEATLGELLLGKHVILPKRENGDEGRSGNRNMDESDIACPVEYGKVLVNTSYYKIEGHFFRTGRRIAPKF